MTSGTIHISIAIATCCRGPMLREALEHLLPQAESMPFPTEFVIVDDNSTDDTAEVLLQFQRRARVPVAVVRGEGRGVAAARNLCVVHSRGTWVAFCDDDQIAAPNWLYCLHDAARRTSADFVGGSMNLQLPAKCTLTHFGPRARRLLGECGLTGGEKRLRTGRNPATNNVLMRTEVVRRLGLFDTSFTEGGEDTELFSRAYAAGHNIWFTPRARMRHMLTEERVTAPGLRWTAMRIGSTDTRMLHLRNRVVAPLRHAAGRAAVLVLRDLPQLGVATVCRARAKALDARCSIWYTTGVLRSLHVLVRPGARGNRAFLQRLDFRGRNGERIA